LALLIQIGTRGYAPQVQRRLQVVNATALAAAGVAVAFATFYAVNDYQTMRPLVWMDLIMAVAWVAVPAWHRLGSVAGGVFLIVIGVVGLSLQSALLGAASGKHLYLVLAPALVVLFLGPGRPAVSLAVVASAVVAHLTVQYFSMTAPPTIWLSPAVLFGTYAAAFVVTCALLFATVRYAFRLVDRAEAAAEHERARSDRLLESILPRAVAERLKGDHEAVVADRLESVTLLFADLTGFTTWAARVDPGDVVAFLDRLFSAFDALARKHGLEKIKTMGDAYMVMGGSPLLRTDHADAVARMALDMQALMQGPIGAGFRLRIGIHTGPVIAGVIGSTKPAYDVWGATVNLAQRLESHAAPGQILLSGATAERMRGPFCFLDAGTIDLNDVGPTQCVILSGEVPQAPASRDPSSPELALVAAPC
jgi:class 3 adenylate cyclase